MVGNLTREEARTYFFDYVLPFCKHPPGANEAWERVYEVCGGNPGLLLKCAGDGLAHGSWENGALCGRTLRSSGRPPRLRSVACTQAAMPSCKQR